MLVVLVLEWRRQLPLLKRAVLMGEVLQATRNGRRIESVVVVVLVVLELVGAVVANGRYVGQHVARVAATRLGQQQRVARGRRQRRRVRAHRG